MIAEVLARLRHHAVVGGDDQQEHVDAGGARHHRAHEPLVPRHVDDRQPPAGRERERRVAELDRDAARLLLRQPVGVDPGQRGDERRLAVVDVAGRAEGQRLISRHWSSVRVRQSSSTRPSRTTRHHGRVGRAQCGCSASPPVERAGEARKLEQRHGPAADPGDARDDRRRRAARPAAGRASRTASADSAAAAQDGDLAQGALRVAVELERRLEGRERQLVDPHRPRAADGGGCARRRRRCRRSRRPAGRRAACRPRSRPTVAPASIELRAVGSSARSGRSSSWPEPRSSTSGRPCFAASAASSSSRGEAVKPTMRKFDWCTRTSAAVSGADRAPRSRAATCGWSCRPRPAARPTGRGCRGCGSRRRSRSARRG